VGIPTPKLDEHVLTRITKKTGSFFNKEVAELGWVQENCMLKKTPTILLAEVTFF
jgi:hypothetical protein